MIKLLFLALLWPSIAFSQDLVQGEQEFLYPEFRECGLVTRYASNKIGPNCLTEAKNVLYDEDFSLMRRRGYGPFTTTACGDLKSIRGMWRYDALDGTRYVVLQSSQTMYYIKQDGACTPISLLSNLNTTNELECVQSLGKLWCTNGVDAPFYTNIISTGSFGFGNGTQYYATMIGTFRNRIVLAGISGEPSRIRMSEEGDGTKWNTIIPGASTTSATIDISGGEDGKSVTALMGQYQNAFEIGREDEIWALSGNDRRDFTLRQVSSQVGVKDRRTIREKDNCLYWLSNRGYEKQCGTKIDRISDPIRPILDEIIQSAGNSRNKNYSTPDEWAAGLYNTSLPGEGPTSVTIYPGSVVPSTWAVIETEGYQFNEGTLVNIDTTTTTGAIKIDIDTETNSGLFADFSYGVLGDTWTYSDCDISSQMLRCVHGTGYAYTASNNAYGVWKATLPILSGIGVAGASSFDFIINSNPPVFGGNNTGYTLIYGYSPTQVITFLLQRRGSPQATVCFNATPITTTSLDIKITRNKSGLFNVYGNNSLLCSGTDTYYSSSTYLGFGFNSGGGATYEYIDNIRTPSFFSYGNFISQRFDTTFSTPTGGPFYFSDYIPDGSTIAYSVRQSSDPVTWDDWALVSTDTTGVYRIPFTKRYWAYKADFSTQYSTQTPVLNEIELQATTTGYYIGDCVNTQGVTSWGNFRPATVLTGNNAISYSVTTGQSCNEVTRATATWYSQLANSPISLSTAPYLGFKPYFDPKTTTDTIRLDGLTVEWNEGQQRPPMASSVHRDRIHLFYSTDTVTGAYNNKDLVLDSGDKWTLFDNINAKSAVVFNNKLLTGDALETGVVYQQDLGIDDNGSDFDFYIKTSDFDFGNPIEKKVLKRLYLTLKTEAVTGQDINLTVKYYINGSTTAYSLQSVNLNESVENGYFIAKFPVNENLPATFNWLAVSVEYDGKQGPVSIYQIRAIYKKLRYE